MTRRHDAAPELTGSSVGRGDGGGPAGVVPGRLPASNDSEWCARCDRLMPLDDLVEVTRIRTGETSYVCRPLFRDRQCFRFGTGRADAYRIARPRSNGLETPERSQTP